MASESYGGFVQFPLALLANKRTFRDTLSLVLGYAVVSFINKTRADGEAEFRERSRVEQEDAMRKAREVIKFEGGTAKRFLELYNDGDRFVRQWTDRHGPTCQVRLRIDLLFGCRDRDEPTERELRILIGLYSVIGDKSYAKVGWPLLQARTAGLMRPIPKPMPSDLYDHGPIFTRRQIDRTCAELVHRSLVVSATYNRGERFWSHSLNHEQLWARIRQRKLGRLEKLRHHREADSNHSRAIAASLAKAESLPLINVHPPSSGGAPHVDCTSREAHGQVQGRVHDSVHVNRNSGDRTSEDKNPSVARAEPAKAASAVSAPV